MHALLLTDRGLVHQREARAAAPKHVKLEILRDPSEAEVIAHARRADVIISERDRPVTAAMIKAAPKLRKIIRLGSLSLGIDLDAAREAGVEVSLRPVGTSIAAAEHVVLMSLALLRRLKRSLVEAAIAVDSKDASRPTDENTFSYNWNGWSDLQTLKGRTVAILGMGEIGVELARRLAAFEPRELLYVKRNRYPEDVEAALGIEHADRAEAIARADVLFVLLPFTPKTARSFGAAELAMMKPTAHLVAAGSGGVIDEDALAEAITARRIAGAALDTFASEPLRDDHPLVELALDHESNVLLTPHVASGSLGEGRAEDFADLS